MISINNVTKSFDENKVFDDFSLEIPKGSAYGLLGSNGAGKSTLLRMLCGIYSTQSGEIQIDGRIQDGSDEIKKKMFFVNDETLQLSAFTLLSLKKFYSGLYPDFSDESWEKLVSVLKLPKDKKLSTFSKGMKRQAILITAVSCRPEYLFLDEAFDGIDPATRIVLKKLIIDEMIDNSMTVVISSHNLSEIEEFCDVVGMLHDGKLVFSKELDSIKGNIHKIQTAFDKTVTSEDFPGLDILNISYHGSVCYIIVRGEAETVVAQVEKKKPKFIDVVPLSLKEIFIHEMEGLGYDFNID